VEVQVQAVVEAPAEPEHERVAPAAVPQEPQNDVDWWAKQLGCPLEAA
jgi:hypothetical protein